MKYYTYAHLREDGTPFYIGKGQGDRINSPERRLHLPPVERRIYLKHFDNEDDAYRHEMYMIAILPNLRNLTSGGEGFRGRHSETTREGMRQRGRQRGNSMLLRGNPSRFVGKKHSEETKKKMSLAHKGRKKGPMSEETKRKISEAKKGCIPWNKS